MKDMRKGLQISILVGGVYIVLNRFTNTPDLFLGLLMGLALCFYIVGLLPDKTYSRLKAWKKVVIKQKGL